MKRRTRYLFIALGFLVFGIISPLIVLYVSGFSYDWKTDSITATGLLSVKTEPSRAKIYLDGEEAGTSPSTIRFLKPKDYDVVIKKDGYFDWTKRLEIKSGKVTWASDRLPELNLIRRDPAAVIVTSSVRDFVVGNDFVLYLTDASLVKTDLGLAPATHSAKLPASCETITLSPTQNLILLTCGQTRYLYDQKTLAAVSIPLLPQEAYVFGPEDSLYSLEKQALIKTNSETGKREQIATGTSAFGFQGNSLYRLQTSPSGQALVTSPLYSPNQTQILMDGIPTFKKVQLLVSRPKEIFLFADSALYRVNETLEPLLSGVTEIGFDPELPALTYTTGFELYSYDFSRGTGQLIVRQAGALREPQGKTDIGYVLYINETKLQATEIDSRDHVNNYTLSTGPELKKYATDPAHMLVYFLDGSSLKFLRLR
jgi:hypothetical protein